MQTFHIGTKVTSDTINWSLSRYLFSLLCCWDCLCSQRRAYCGELFLLVILFCLQGEHKSETGCSPVIHLLSPALSSWQHVSGHFESWELSPRERDKCTPTGCWVLPVSPWDFWILILRTSPLLRVLHSFSLRLNPPLLALLQSDILCGWLILHVHREPKEGKHSFLGYFLQTARQALQFLGQLALVRVSAWGLGSESMARMVPAWPPTDSSVARVGSLPDTRNHQLHHLLEERSSTLSWSQKETMIFFQGKRIYSCLSDPNLNLSVPKEAVKPKDQPLVFTTEAPF